MAAKKAEKFKGVGNHRYAVEMHGLRSSNAAGTHADKRTRRERDRASQTRRAVSRSLSEG